MKGEEGGGGERRETGRREGEKWKGEEKRKEEGRRGERRERGKQVPTAKRVYASSPLSHCLNRTLSSEQGGVSNLSLTIFRFSAILS